LRRIVVLLVVLMLAAGCTASRAERRVADDRPNFLIVISDDERIGSEIGRPFVHNWFKQGTTFTQAYATTPQCCPSRASILTGQYAHNHEVHRKRDVERIVATHTLPFALKKSGYQTGFAGKYLNGWSDQRKPPYFDRWAHGVGYNDRPFIVQGKKRRAPYGPTFVFDLGKDDISPWEKEDEAPWLLVLAPSTPHDPFQPEKKYAEVPFSWRGTPATQEADRSDKPPYVRRKGYSEGFGDEQREAQLRTLRTLDDDFEELVKHLHDTGELERTVVIYVSDNGYMWSEHGLVGKGVPYLSSVRVPMYMRGPGIPARRNDSLVANIDIAPTIYKMAKVDPGYTTDGRDLRTSRRQHLLLEFEGGGSIPKWSSLVTKDWQYIQYGSGLREFYDLKTDPYQLENDPSRLTPERVALLSRLRTCKGAVRCP
jgi:arylsulfatase A-like enzyme